MQKLDIIIDGQFGSTGKGVLGGYLATRYEEPLGLCVTNAGPNSGHTVDYADSRGKMVTYHVPSSALCTRSEPPIYLTAGSIIDPLVLITECAQYDVDPTRVVIHPHAAVVEEEHRREEKIATSYAKHGSTMKGTGASLSAKITRRGNVAKESRILRQHGFKIEAMDLRDELRKIGKRPALMEVPQGVGLGVNSGFYPFVTSREISVSQALSDAQLHPYYLGDVYMSVRTFPIRVGHVYDESGEMIGHSGPFFADSDELSWEDIGVTPELTTVTKRVRRVATFSFEQYKSAYHLIRPDYVFLNFANYMYDNELRELARLMSEIKIPDLMGYGPSVKDVRRYLNTQVI